MLKESALLKNWGLSWRENWSLPRKAKKLAPKKLMRVQRTDTEIPKKIFDA